MIEVRSINTVLAPFMSIPSQVSNFFAPQDAEAIGKRDSSAVDRRHVDETQQGNEVRTEQGQDKTDSNGRQKDSVELSREADQIRQMQRRDSEVRAHEAAHSATGGAYAGAPTYTTKRGPDGKTYATGGEVSIDISAIKGDPQATLKKAEQVRSAALAPAQPSSQDMKVAQKAQSMAAKARSEMAQNTSAKLTESIDREQNSSEDDSVSVDSKENPSDDSSSPSMIESSGMARLSVYS
jgi:SprA-related family